MGNVEGTIDAKGRLSIPAKFRGKVDAERDGANWVCVPWPGGVLRIYTEKGFERLADLGESTLTPDPDLAALQTGLYGLSEEVETDTVGRISIPKGVLQRAGLEAGEVVVVGAKDRLEVYDRKRWEESVAEKFANLPLLSSKQRGKGTGAG
jgi:MraZ protein